MEAIHRFLSTKTFGEYSVVFRQHKADNSKCSYAHGHDIRFKVWFSAESLDDKNWVQDFGEFKRNGSKDFLSDLFDHNVCLSDDDPALDEFVRLNSLGLICLKIFRGVGCEKFAEFVFDYLDEVVSSESDGRVSVVKVECFEGATNSAIYEAVE